MTTRTRADASELALRMALSRSASFHNFIMALRVLTNPHPMLMLKLLHQDLAQSAIKFRPAREPIIPDAIDGDERPGILLPFGLPWFCAENVAIVARVLAAPASYTICRSGASAANWRVIA
jgi:hypothetical protein